MKKYREERHLVEQHINATLPAYLMSLVYLIHLILFRKSRIYKYFNNELLHVCCSH